MNRIIIFLIFFFTTQLFALEIWLNGNLYENYTDKSLTELSYTLPNEENEGIYLYELLPIMEEIHSFQFISNNYILEMDLENSLFISHDDSGLLLGNDNIGNITLPKVLEIEGIEADSEKLLIWMDEEDRYLEREIRLFAQLHHLETEFRIEKNLKSLLEYNIFNETIIPDLLIYNDEKLNDMAPLLSTIRTGNIEINIDKALFSINDNLMAIPFKISRQVFLQGSSGGQNHFLTADFGNVDLLYPLFLRFGLMETLTENSMAVKESFFYLTGLYNQGIYKLSHDPDEDFIQGNMNSVYTSSVILDKLKKEPRWTMDAFLPQMGGENPPPLISHKLMSIPMGHSHNAIANALLMHLTAYGTQQRIDPRTGYLPYRKDVYEIIPEGISKEILTDNLENAILLYPDEDWNDLREVLPKIYRLIITGRLTIDEGIMEMVNYINN